MRRKEGFTLIELLVVIAILVVLIALLAVCAGGNIGRMIGGINSSYSHSTRVGTIIKFGDKTNALGFYKSYEGAMIQNEFGMKSSNQSNSTLNGNVWEFSLYENADPALIEKIETAMKTQRRVSLTYNQWRSRPATISTDYVVVEATFPEDVEQTHMPK